LNGLIGPTAIGVDQRSRECHLVVFWTVSYAVDGYRPVGSVDFLVCVSFQHRSGAATVLQVGTLVVFAGLMNKFFGRMESMLRIVYARSVLRPVRIGFLKFSIGRRAFQSPASRFIRGDWKGRIEMTRRAIQIRHARIACTEFDLAIAPGEMIGLVGPTGAGKSTLINLICRFFDVSEGAILVDGVDIRSYPLAEYRKHIGIVLQDPFLFYGTIAETLRMAGRRRRRRKLWRRRGQPGRHEFILQLPDGYDSLVGERGQSLSGGERQRISIAAGAVDRSADFDSRRGDVVGRYGNGAGNSNRAR